MGWVFPAFLVMNSKRKIILFLLLILPGSAVVAIFTYWGCRDYMALVAANQRFTKLANQGASQRDLFIVAHRENTHRINVGFDGTWILLGGILAGMGILGIVQENR
jgi:hypothetical protein